MKRVFSSPTITEAHLVKGILESNDINAIIKNEPISGLIVAVEAWAEVWIVNDHQIDEAQAIIAEFHKELPGVDPPEEAS